MKRIRIVFAFLALVFALSSAFNTNETKKIKVVGDRVETLQYFIPNGLNPITQENGWSLRSPQSEPVCNGDDLPCVLKIYADGSNINNDDFTAFLTETNDFVEVAEIEDMFFKEKN